MRCISFCTHATSFMFIYSVNKKKNCCVSIINEDKKRKKNGENIYGWLLESENWTIKIYWTVTISTYAGRITHTLLTVDFKFQCYCYSPSYYVPSTEWQINRNTQNGYKLCAFSNWTANWICWFQFYFFVFMHWKTEGEFLLLVIILFLEFHIQIWTRLWPNSRDPIMLQI